MKTLLIFLCFLSISQFTSAQWNKIEEIVSPYVYSVLFDGDDIYVGTDTLYISRDKGQTWESKTITGQPVDIISFIKVNNRIFAGLYNWGVYQSTDNGGTWEPFNSGLTGWAKLAKTFAMSGDTLFYGTEGGGIYFVKLNSSNWQSYNQNLPSNFAWTINDIAVSNSNIIAGVGASGIHFIRPKGSAEWIDRIATTPSGRNATFFSLLAFGDTVFAGSNAGIFRSLDNGFNWDSVGIFALPLNVVAFAKDNNRIFAGYTRNIANDYYVWYSDDYGDTWNFLDHQFEYLYRLYIYDNKIWAATAGGLYFNTLPPTSVDPIEKPSSFKLEQNFPNPFNPATNIEFRIADFGFVSLKVYDILGNEVVTLFNEDKPAGNYNVEFNASHLSSGVYFYQLQAGNFSAVKKMILMK